MLDPPGAAGRQHAVGPCRLRPHQPEVPPPHTPCRSAWCLLDGLVDAAADMLAAAWQFEKAKVKMAFVPLPTSETETQAGMLILYRVLVQLEGEHEISRFVLPAVMEALSKRRQHHRAEVPLHTSCCLIACWLSATLLCHAARPHRCSHMDPRPLLAAGLCSCRSLAILHWRCVCHS